MTAFYFTKEPQDVNTWLLNNYADTDVNYKNKKINIFLLCLFLLISELFIQFSFKIFIINFYIFVILLKKSQAI